jgi:UDP-3-O-[3-hydroxymyristoyl] glucosamine N-acyltransferase
VLASELAALVGGALHGPDLDFVGVAPLDKALAPHCAFALRLPVQSEAGVLLATEPVEGHSTVVVPDPKGAFIMLLQRLFPDTHPQGVQPGAHVDPSAQLGPGVVVYPGAYVGPDVRVGADSVILPNAVLLRGTELGTGCVVGPGAVLGHAGFGVHPGPRGPVPVPQVGRVLVEDGVCIGANSCVDRAFLEQTRLGAGAQLDNLVQVGHNCDVGRGVLMAAQVGLSGSVSVGDGAVLGGQVGVSDHVAIGAGAQLGGQAGAIKDLPGGERYWGTPAIPLRALGRIIAASKQLPELLRRVRRLEGLVGAAQDAPSDDCPS